MSGLSLRSFFFYCLLLECVVLLGADDSSKRCQNTRVVVDFLIKAGLPVSVDEVYKDFKAIAGTTCQLEETCCSHKLEEALRDSTAHDYTKKIRDHLMTYLSPCRQASIIDETAALFQEFKAQVIQDLKHVYGSYFDGHETILDDLFSGFVAAVQTGETGNIASLYQETFFEIYLATYLAYPGNGNFPNTQGARACFNEFYIETEGPRVEQWWAAFVPSFNSLMYYMRGLRAVDLLVDKLLQHSISEQCKVSLVKMDMCSSCAGYESLRSCKGLCLNLLRGCLVDLSDLEDPLSSFSQALMDINQHVSETDILNRLVGFERSLFELIGSTSLAAFSIKAKVSKCFAVRKRRSVHSDGEVRVKRQSHLIPRSQVEFPFELYNESANCVQRRISNLLTLPETICGASASRDNDNCWNGHVFDSYSRRVAEFKRATQKFNPEILYCPYPSQFQYEINVLNFVTRELASVSGKCSSDDEDCGSSAPLTSYYKFPAPSYFKSVITSADDEQDVGGSGSGSGEGPVLICEPPSTSSQSTDVNKDAIFQETSGSTTLHWPGALLLVTLSLTLLAALS